MYIYVKYIYIYIYPGTDVCRHVKEGCGGGGGGGGVRGGDKEGVSGGDW